MSGESAWKTDDVLTLPFFNSDKDKILTNTTSVKNLEEAKLRETKWP